MRNKLFNYLSFAACLLVCCSCTQKQQTNKELKVMAWNIWHAGHEKAYPEVGCRNTIDIIKTSGADVVLMVETYGAAPMIADSLGFDYRLLSSNLCIFSRYPITNTYTFADSISTFNFGGIEIDIAGSKVRLFDTWLHYLPDTRLVPTGQSEQEILTWDDEGSRDEEISKILGVLTPYMAQTDSIPVIMGGDFNSHSHLDWTEATKNMYNHGGAVVNWTVSSRIVDAGFKDSFREIHPDPVQNIGTTWLSDGNDAFTRRDRIDFIYYKGNNINPIKSEIYNAELGSTLLFEGKEFLYASDHGFVLTTFQLN